MKQEKMNLVDRLKDPFIVGSVIGTTVPVIGTFCGYQLGGEQQEQQQEQEQH